MITRRVQPTGRTTATLAAVALLFSSAALRAQGRGSDSAAPELVLVDVRLGEAASATLQGQRIGDSLRLPTRDVCALAELPCERVAEAYVSLDSIAALFHARVSLDWTQLMVLVTECDALPVVRRHARTAARDALHARRRSEPTAPDEFVARSPMGLSPVVRLQYGMTAASSSLSAAEHVLTVGTAAFRGALQMQLALTRSTTTRSSPRPTVNGVSWVRAWLGPRPVRQLRLGDIEVGGVGMLRGASITNAPYDGSGGIDSVLVTGATDPGREVEAFRDGTLVAADSAAGNGSYSLWLPSNSGANSFTIASYGLSEVPRYTRRIILVDPGMLSANSFRYTLASGLCRSHLCRGAGNLDVRYAPLDWLTASATVRAVGLDDRSASVDFDTRLAARISNTLFASVARTASRTQRAELWTTAHLAPTAALDVLGTYRYGGTARTDAPPDSPLRPIHATHPTHASLWMSWQPHRRRLQPNVTAQLTTSRSEARSNTAARFGLGLPLSVAYVAPFARYTSVSDGAAERRVVSFGSDALIRATCAPSVFGRSLLRLTAETSSLSALATGSASISIPLLGALSLDAQATWTGAHRPIASLTLRESIRGFRIANTVATPSSGNALTLYTLDGSVLLDAQRRLITTGRAAVLGGASIKGTVYIDVNHNDRFDPGEQPLPGAYIRAGGGGAGALADSSGEYELRDVAPYAPVLIQIDPLTLPQESLTPLHRAIRATAVPNQSLRVDIAVVENAITTPAPRSALAQPKALR